MKKGGANSQAPRLPRRGSKYLAAITLAVCLTSGSSRVNCAGQTITRKQLDRVDWQPTEVIPGARYVGGEACAQCHSGEAAEQQSSGMAHALQLPARSGVLETHRQLIFNNGPYGYTIARSGDQVSYTVTDGASTISVPVSWDFGYGLGEVGQTYLLYYNGSYYESRVSYFSGIDRLDVTLGHPTTVPKSLEDAIGREVKPEELRACFGCHSTGAVSGTHLQMDKLVPGITCEGCHGPGGEHVAAMQAGKSRERHILNPARLTPGDLVKFCGACHRTGAHVKEIQAKGVTTVRFQPYRLGESACFNPRDRRISCLACHNPHQNPQSEPAFYDSKCQACHGNKEVPPTPQRATPTCPVAESRCVTCHMPKYMIAGSHFKFTDHKIRVVRLGDNVE